jgi:hypothetical protein
VDDFEAGFETPEGRVNGVYFWGFDFFPWERCFWRLFLPILRAIGVEEGRMWGLAQRVLMIEEKL